MARTGRPEVKLELRHDAEKLKAAYKASTDAVERRRIQVIWFLAEGKSRKEVAELTAYSDLNVWRIIKRYNEKGLAGLEDKRHDHPGPAPLLSDEELGKLLLALQAAPEEGGLWSGKKVVAWIAKHLGKKVYEQRAYEYLKQLYYSPQVPRPQHVRADKVEQEDFKKSSFQQD